MTPIRNPSDGSTDEIQKPQLPVIEEEGRIIAGTKDEDRRLVRDRDWLRKYNERKGSSDVEA
jgi:hypothetical protein